jgi:hypothetical protein
MTSTVTLYSLTIVFSEVSRLHSCFGTCAAPATAQWVPVSNPGVAHRPVGPGSRREDKAQARFPYLFAQVPPATTCWPGRTVWSRSAAKLRYLVHATWLHGIGSGHVDRVIHPASGRSVRGSMQCRRDVVGSSDQDMVSSWSFPLLKNSTNLAFASLVNPLHGRLEG